MDDVLMMNSVSDYCDFLGVACRNELVEAIDFTKLTGVVRRRKMFGFYTLVRCKILLSGTDKPVSTIAEELGYGYTHHLTCVFKKMTGMTPQEYRKQRGQS